MTAKRESDTPITDNAKSTAIGMLARGDSEGAIFRLLNECENLERDRARLIEALRDMLSGWRYIRQQHGDLYGVGWDRAQRKAEQALGEGEAA